MKKCDSIIKMDSVLLSIIPKNLRFRMIPFIPKMDSINTKMHWDLKTFNTKMDSIIPE